MSLAVIEPPTDLGFETGGKGEEWLSIFGFDGLFSEPEMQIVNDSLITHRPTIFEWLPKGPGNVIMMGASGSLEVAVFEAAETIRPVVEMITPSLVMVFFVHFDDMKKSIEGNGAINGAGFTQDVLSYLERGKNEG